MKRLPDEFKSGRFHWVYLVGSIGCATTLGCGDAATTLEAIQNAVPVRGITATPSQESQTADVQATPVAFDPVSPDRVNPFVYPGGEQDERSGFAVRGANASQVKVLGFADVGVPRVFLRIEDETKILREGDQAMNIRVVKINPPNVVLAIDNLTWTATMFDDR
ncbi:hypothetical protein V7x_48670 [Crateriforma conspicua]|uniref:Uncharacterized protein n=1 Tax=Crateriforma conspicua TaxID=2527996 RepID=A0A5C6FNZ7_9PLAN|nr:MULTISPECIES: hypothetical protein [Crateriforma]TWU63129.1 hypothetical protein V7x_48670 [Crateriforma conspicua]